MEVKAGPPVQVKVVDEDKGEVEAVFSTLNVVDKDKDVTLPGAFGEQNVRISAYNHQSWQGALPIGKGTIREQGNEAIVKAQFFMNVQSAKDHFNVIKELGEMMEWSYGYDILERSEGKWPDDGKGEGETVQFLKKLKVHECSPVILGAGESTRTISAKRLKAALTAAQMTSASAIAMQIMRLVGDTANPPDQEVVDNLIDKLEQAIGVQETETDDTSKSGSARNKGAIPYSETGTTDVNWDAGLMTRRVSAAQSPLRAMHAWVNTGSSADSKTSYKFPHHMVSDNGAVGAANIRAATAGIAVLNGGRGGANIPNSDRQGVYLHLAHHIRDSGGTAPPLKTSAEIEMAFDSAKIKMELFDHVAWSSAIFTDVVTRVAEAAAQRAENGQQLAEPTLDMVKALLSESDRLREATAIQPRNETSHQLTEQIFRNSRALLMLSNSNEGTS